MPLTVEDYEAALKDINSTLANVRASARQVKASTAQSLASIQALASRHAEVLSAIDAVNPASADAFELTQKAKKQRLDAEVSDLLTKIAAAREALAILDL